MPESNPSDKLIIAFAQGAQWWEYFSRGATMWNDDRRLAEEEAERRLANGTLGRVRTKAVEESE